MVASAARAPIDPSRPASRDDFDIAIVCALPVEFDAVCLLVDKFWDTEGDAYGRAPGDQNLYTTGRIGHHNVVLVLLPGMGKVSGASTAASLRYSYAKLKLVVLAGVCGGVPGAGKDHEILLGDVVISQQIVQFDFGKQYPGQFVPKDGVQDTLRRPERAVRTILATMHTEHGLERLQHGVAQYLPELQLNAGLKGRKATYLYPGIDQDVLFPQDYTHRHHGSSTCECANDAFPCPQALQASCQELGCDLSKSVGRQRLAQRDGLRVFVGNVGSGDTVMKSGRDRDKIAGLHDLVAFEMEGAGIWDEMPCIIIKGVSDYSDSHKHKTWQPFAAAASAAVTKALLIYFVQLHGGQATPILPAVGKTLERDLGRLPASDKQRHQTYRLRNLPADVDRLAAARLLVAAVSDSRLNSDAVEIYSLASAVGWYHKSQSKVATLSFKVHLDMLQPSSADNQLRSREWALPVVGLSEPLVLDAHFEGLTVLNEVHESRHQFDCIALPGLVGHPFQCWQSLPNDSAFMWIRDALPRLRPDTRFLIYGHISVDTRQKSAQTVLALARTLMLTLDASGMSEPSSKPLLFLSHSLGGIVLKQMCVLLADGSQRARHTLRTIKGLVFFGTPSRGMPVPSLLSLLGSQPDRDTIERLSDQSDILTTLETQFSGVASHAGIRSVWAYETQPSLITVNTTVGTITRAQSSGIIVDRSSATGGREDSSTQVVQIDKSHWDMIRFTRGDHQIRVWAGKLNDLCRDQYRRIALANISQDEDDDGFEINQSGSEDESSATQHGVTEETTQEHAMRWQYNLFVHPSISEEAGQRFAQIEENYDQTFHWAFDDPSIGLTDWLQDGDGIFWVSGKPGSGKSTFMKFLLRDQRTTELMQSCKRWRHQITASFFFHHRGTRLQKSFEGLLQSLLGQILQEEPELFSVICPMLDDKLQNALAANKLGSLASDTRNLLRSIAGSGYDHKLAEELVSLLSVDPAATLDAALDKGCPGLENAYKSSLKRVLLLAFQTLSGHGTISGRLWREILSLSSKAERVDTDLLEDVITAWRSNVNYHRLTREFLQKHNLLMVSAMEDTGPAPFAQVEDFDVGTMRYLHAKLITRYAERQIARQQLRFDILLSSWSRADLEEAVRRMFEQDILDLRICLFFDALDEYDGRPEAIAEFLKDLTSQPASSRTQTRVLFSSRPWPVFQDEFGTSPGLRIHEHTRDDIRGYCTGMLQENHMSPTALLPMAESIADRAQGVFLWVRLLLHDLGSASAHRAYRDVPLEKLLQQRLVTAPDELHDYYTTIVQRLPSASKREGYVLLECLSKSTTNFTIEQIPMLLSSGSHQNPLPLLASSLRTTTRFKELEGYVNKITGGLINLVSKSEATSKPSQGLFISTRDATITSMTVQLMHQTCKEWVEAATFKHVMLEGQAGATPENGHSFLARYWAFQHAMFGGPDELAGHAERFCFHVTEAERTTGVSQYEFLKTLSGSFYQRLGLLRVDSAASFAVHQGLWLYLEDAANHADTSIAELEESLFSILWRKVDGEHAVDDTRAVEASMMLLQLGFRAYMDPIGVSKLVGRMWLSQDQEVAASFMELVKFAVRTTLPMQFTFPRPRTSRNDLDSVDQQDDADDKRDAKDRLGSRDLGRWRVTSQFAVAGQCKLVHLSPPELARWLIEQDPEQASIFGSQMETPLDHLMKEAFVDEIHPDLHYELLKTFVMAGGLFSSASDLEILEMFRKLSGLGFDVERLMWTIAPGLIPISDMEDWPIYLGPRVKRVIGSSFVSLPPLLHNTALHIEEMDRAARAPPSLQYEESQNEGSQLPERFDAAIHPPGQEFLVHELSEECIARHKLNNVYELEGDYPSLAREELTVEVRRHSPLRRSREMQRQDGEEPPAGNEGIAVRDSRRTLRTRNKLLGILSGRDLSSRR